jgi:TIGR03009 family protein
MLVPLLLALLSVERPQVAQLPVAPPPRLAVVEMHLAAWKEETSKFTNIREVISMTRRDAAGEDKKNYSGVFLGMRPNYFRLRLDNNADPAGNDYEAFICDGKAVFAYSGLQKTITARSVVQETPTRPVGPPTEEESITERWVQFFEQIVRAMNPGEHFALKCLVGSETIFDKKQYQITLALAGKNFIQLDVEPLLPDGKKQFTKARVSLFAPNTKFAYTVAAVALTLPNGETEVWKFTEQQLNIPKVTAKDFAFQKVLGFKLNDLRTPSKP